VTAGGRRLVLGATVTDLALQALRLRPPGGQQRWQRINFRQRPVSLLAGPALALGVSVSSSRPISAALAGLGAGALGSYDDQAGAGDVAKGLQGHLGALRAGRLSTGTAKLIGIPLAGAVAAAVQRPRRPLDVLLGAGVVAAAANALNLFDLRPGRALKVGVLVAAALGEPGIAGSCAALLPADLAEETMLGDAGANALGAVLGVAVVSRLNGRRSRGAALVGLAALTAASEVVSFSEIIDRTPLLHRFDQLGRRS
jgi:UDP-N-acetylmuramyl pentapeptide phosphotransferase/UDP-N-acetylglucosamine-1-phosphate transferase